MKPTISSELVEALQRLTASIQAERKENNDTVYERKD